LKKKRGEETGGENTTSQFVSTFHDRNAKGKGKKKREHRENENNNNGVGESRSSIMETSKGGLKRGLLAL